MTRTLLLVLALEVALAGWWALPSVHADDELAEALSAATTGPMRRPASTKSSPSFVLRSAQKPMTSSANAP